MSDMSDMSDRIEQIARAIYDRTVEIHKTGPILEFSVDEAGFYMVIARAAYLATLRSIREPGKEQVAAGYAKDCGNQICSYRGMIDHLIAEADNGD